MERKTSNMSISPRVGFIVYIANTLQVNLLVKNVLSVIKQEKYLGIEVAIQSEVAFLKMKTEKNFTRPMTDTIQKKEYHTTTGSSQLCTVLLNIITLWKSIFLATSPPILIPDISPQGHNNYSSQR